MKKHQYTYKVDPLYDFSDSSLNHLRAKNKNTTLITEAYHKRARNNSESQQTPPHSIWTQGEDVEIRMKDEISTNELKAFSFNSIEAMANLANFDKGETILSILIKTTNEHLTAFTSLARELKTSQKELKQNSAHEKGYKASHSNYHDTSSITALEILEQNMLSTYKQQALQNRVNYLIEEVPKQVQQAGIELQLPAPIMQKLANHIRKALQTIARN